MRHYLRHIDLPEDVDAESPEKKDEQRQAEREELNVLIEKSNDVSEQSQLERTRELLGYVQAGNDKLLVESSEEKENRMEQNAEDILSNIYD